MLDVTRERDCGTKLHVVGDLGDLVFERSFEYPGEYQYIVDLIGIVGTPGPDDTNPRSLRELGHDLRGWICECEDDWIFIHFRYILYFERSRSRYSDEHVRADQGI